MSPEDWKKEIDQTISKAKAAYEDAQSRASEQNREITIRVEALTDQLERYNSNQEREGPGKRRRENWTIGGLLATAFFTLALAGFALWQVVETVRLTIQSKNPPTLPKNPPKFPNEPRSPSSDRYLLPLCRSRWSLNPALSEPDGISMASVSKI
jgi:hypothetical protein